MLNILKNRNEQRLVTIENNTFINRLSFKDNEYNSNIQYNNFNMLKNSISENKTIDQQKSIGYCHNNFSIIDSLPDRFNPDTKSNINISCTELIQDKSKKNKNPEKKISKQDLVTITYIKYDNIGIDASLLNPGVFLFNMNKEIYNMLISIISQIEINKPKIIKNNYTSTSTLQEWKDKEDKLYCNMSDWEKHSDIKLELFSLDNKDHRKIIRLCQNNITDKVNVYEQVLMKDKRTILITSGNYKIPIVVNLY